MKKISDIKSAIPHDIRHKCTIKANNIEEKLRGEKGTKYQDFKYSAEAFNDTDIFRNPNKIGITIYYPNEENSTHIICGIYPFDIPMNSLEKEIRRMYKQLEEKIPGRQKND